MEQKVIKINMYVLRNHLQKHYQRQHHVLKWLCLFSVSVVQAYTVLD